MTNLGGSDRKASDLLQVPQLLAFVATAAQLRHDDYVSRYRAAFGEFPPDDRGVYVYTYYDGSGYPLYHGYTTDAWQRAREHQKKAPWAS